MIISGLQKTTLLDYPEHVAATVFLGGCNFRCPFCHNMDIVELSETTVLKENVVKYSEEDILAFLRKRSGVLDGVCITGGEPTIYKELLGFIKSIKKIRNIENDRPFLIKLDTNGTNPEMLKNLIENKMIDYIAMDIKSSIDNYKDVAGIISDELTENIIESVKIIINSGIEYEFRTTIVKDYHDEDVMRNIGRLISGAKKYYLQSFIDSEYVPNHELKACDKDTLSRFVEIMKEYVDTVELRGVD